MILVKQLYLLNSVQMTSLSHRLSSVLFQIGYADAQSICHKTFVSNVET